MAILVISAKYVIAAAIDVQSGLPEQKSESWELFSRCVLKNPPFWIFGLVPYFRAIRPSRTQFFNFSHFNVQESTTLSSTFLVNFKSCITLTSATEISSCLFLMIGPVSERTNTTFLDFF